MSMLTEVRNLRRGDLVRASMRLDMTGADVFAGDYGVVFEEADHYEQGTGPMVRWFSGGACNVYDGDVRKVYR